MTTEPDHILDLQGASELVQSMGFRCSKRTMRRWADERRLPFFKWGGRIVIFRNELIMHFRRLQLEAVNEVQKRRRTQL